MTPEERVAVIGGGVIGASWAALFLAHGHQVSVADPDSGAETNARRLIESYWPLLEKLGLKPGAAPDRIVFSPDVATAVRDAAFVQENGPEVLALKHDIIAQVERAIEPDAIIASSSSGLLASDIQDAAKFPGRIVIGHPLNPPHLIPIVEIVRGAKTTTDTMDRACAFYRGLGKRPIVLNKEVKGHLVNRLQVALWREAFCLIEDGVASVADVDAAISYGAGLRWAVMGPFLALHASGGAGGITRTLTHLGPAQREWAADLGVYPETDDYIETMASGVSKELEGFDFSETLKQRDQMLIDLLLLKKSATQIP